MSTSIFFVTGISAAGKSTVAQALAERFDRAVHVKGDVFRRMIVRGRVPMRPERSEEAQRQLALRYRLGAATADAYLAAGFTVVLQDIVLGEYLPRYVGMIRGRPLHLVVLAPRPDVVAAREEARSKRAYRSEVTVDDLDRILRHETPRLGLWLDSSEQAPAETVDEILSRRKESLIA